MVFYNIADEKNEDNKRELNYFNDKSKYFNCKISNDLSTIALVNYKENIQLAIRQSKEKPDKKYCV